MGRPTAWMIFLGYLALVGVGAALGVETRAVRRWLFDE